MCRLNLRIRTILLLASTAVTTYGQTLEENYNNGSINQRKTDCWIFDDFEINQSNPINTAGGEKKHGATVDMDLWYNVYSAAGFTTPFLYFDGTGNLSFKHKADDDEIYFLDSELDVYLIDPQGNISNVLNHEYKRLSLVNPQPNGDPTAVQNASVPLLQGYYRLTWEWTDFTSWTEFYIDDINIDTSGISFFETDTVCMNEIAQHTPTGAVNAGAPYNFEYTWSWVGTPGGILTTQTTNDRTAQVDWNVGPGTYRLKSVETYDNGNCNGRTFYVDVTVNEQPNFAISIDTVCQGQQPAMFFEGLTGKAPFTVNYNDGSGSKIFTTSGSSKSVLLAADAGNVGITSVLDDNGCNADTLLLISYPIYYKPVPSTGLIYRQ